MAKVAILGDGQLAQLSALAAQDMGHETMIYGAVGKESPAGQVSEYTKIVYDNTKETVAKILEWKPDVVTLDWENVPAKLAQAIEDAGIKMYPNSRVLGVIQDRYTEKEAIVEAGAEVAQHGKIEDIKSVWDAFKKNPDGIILKTRREGYDGKGQFKIECIDDIVTFQEECVDIEPGVWIYEKCIDFDYELSVIVARRPGGNTVTFEPAHNIHKKGILDQSIIPAIDSEAIAGFIDQSIVDKAKKAAEEITEHMGVVGLLAVEMFVKNGEIIINEVAPRPHNSGHGTIESYNMSQYEALIKAILDEDFGKLEQHKKSHLYNLLNGELCNMSGRRTDKGASQFDEGEYRVYDYGKGLGLTNDGEGTDSIRKRGHKVKVG